MPLDTAKIFPRWMQEFKRFQTLKSQFYLYGNVYDCYYFPVNYHETESINDLRWARFNDIRYLLKLYLKNEGYEIIAYYDVIDGFDIESIDTEISKHNLIEFLGENNANVKSHFGSKQIDKIEKNLSDTLSLFRSLVSNNQKLSVGIINYTSRFSSDPNLLAEEERRHFLKLLKSAQEARILPDKNGMRNILIFICDKLSDIPVWILLENPLTKGIEVLKPNKDERNRFFHVQSERFYQKEMPIDVKKISTVFSDITDGFANQELENLVTISMQEKIHVNHIQQIADLFKYGTKENFWEDLEKSKIDNAEAELNKRVLGQNLAIRKSVEVIRRAKLGLHTIDQKKHKKNKPKGVLFFAGPTGVGKTELAKSLAELIFNDEDAILRFDMSEYNDSNSDVKLIGSPPGYVGYEEGGQLTSQMKAKPFSIVLFDEIEKAHPRVFDKFLQILDDGRLTDGKGETIYFSESLIIFTSNLGLFKEDEHGRRIHNVEFENSYEEMSENIMAEIENFFNAKLNRPEILNRFGDNFVVFDFIRPDVDKSILLMNLNIIKTNLIKQKNCHFEFDDTFVEQFRKHYIADNLINGGRGINNRVETYIKNGITNFMFEQNKTEDLQFRIFVDESNNNMVSFECIGS
ncbi:MAG: ATP-dependent Clp protease ATP-binding subunit [Desulfobacteraceae bacterium]|nr:ATP-dependent Clp protease ATP-binding subunit [Desulfobacteraceae bacterium]MBC2718817.1 ATP-dependent Clp protease ATP-binding subunit [Desulfobacteraceae bacterium]